MEKEEQLDERWKHNECGKPEEQRELPEGRWWVSQTVDRAGIEEEPQSTGFCFC